MTALSTGALSQSPITNQDIFIPFVAIMQINPPAGYGKRRERDFELEKIANLAESDLNAAMIANGYTTDTANPIKFTMAFGNFVAKMTIIGNVKRLRSEIPNKPTKEVTVLNAGKGVVGYGCVNAANRVADDYVISFATELRLSLESIISNAEVLSLEVAGVRFGNRGRTFNY